MLIGLWRSRVPTQSMNLIEPEARKRLAWGEAKRNPRNDGYFDAMRRDLKGREKGR